MPQFKNGRWRARAKRNTTEYFLGTFPTLEQALAAETTFANHYPPAINNRSRYHMNETFPLPLQNKPERELLYKWIAEEEVYVASKFDTQRDDHDKKLKEDFQWWVRQITQYLDRTSAFLDYSCEASPTGVGNRDRQVLNHKAQQAMAKCMMTCKGLVESSIRVLGPLPQPGVPSGEVLPWTRKDDGLKGESGVV